MEMNYIAELNRFYGYCISKQLSKSEIALLHALYMINNAEGWETVWFEADNQIIQRLTGGYSRESINEARNKLKQRGRIDFKEGVRNTRAAKYRIISFVNGAKVDKKVDIQVDKQVDILVDEQVDIQVDPFIKLNQTRVEKDINNILPEPQKPQRSSPDIPALYAELCPDLPQIRVVTKKREAAVKKLVQQISEQDIKAAFTVFNRSDFCKGVNDRGWKADFDFCINPESIAKALEGKYEDRVIHAPPVAAKETVNERNNRLLNEFFGGDGAYDTARIEGFA